jgi:hypothetical protein
MKKLLFTLLIAIAVITSCENSQNEQIPDGVYTGTFQRQLAFGGGDTANIVLTFSSNTWTGQSDIPKYPALCQGTYTIDNQQIMFTNDCIWTAEFDGTLILGGEYTLSLNGNRLGFLRDDRGPSRDTYIDIYKLTKKE